MTWEFRIEAVLQGCVRVRALAGTKPLSYGETIALWIDDGGFRDWYTRLLARAPFEAYCWETPALARSNIDREFEFVLVDVPALWDSPADPAPFAEHFNRCAPGVDVAGFPNVGGDAFLVAPVPIGAASPYSHLAAFLRSAPRKQCHALWQVVGAAIAQRLSDAPLWVSTAGLGVSWLHIRLDTRPKYYRFDEYRWVD